MFKIKESRNSYSFSFDDNFLNDPHEISLIDNSEFLITNKKIKNFLESQNKFLNFYSILKRKNNYFLEIKKLLRTKRLKLLIMKILINLLTEDSNHLT